MRRISFLGALVAVLGAAWLGQAANPATAPNTPERIDVLVKQLGSSRFAEREKAQRELEAIGTPARDRLWKATASADQEIGRRAGELVHKIDAAALAARLLAPKRVNLQLKDVPVPAALAELTKQCGYPIRIAGSRATLDKRKLTLATGEVSFWEAFDALCLQAQLVDTMPVVPAADPLPGFQPMPARAQLVVKDGKPLSRPTCYAGAIRIRAVPFTAPADVRAGEAMLLLEVAPEPRLEHFALAGSSRIRKPGMTRDRS